MARRGVPIIAPALAQQAARCIKKAADGIEGLAKSELALAMVLHTISVETELDREDVAKVVTELARLPVHCLGEESIEEEENAQPRRRWRRRGGKKKK